jgi:hypothetical protein
LAFDKTNTGSLNKNKEKDDAHPTWADYKGQLNIDGAEYWLSAWIKDGPNGKFMSLSAKIKEAVNARPAKASRASDDIDWP